MGTDLLAPGALSEAELERRDRVVGDIIHDLQSGRSRVKAFAQAVQWMTDEQLGRCVEAIDHTCQSLFMLRGAIGCEIQRRMHERAQLRRQLPRSQWDQAPNPQTEPQVTKEFESLAREFRVNPRTLRDDARIYSTFFRGKDEVVTEADILPRQMYVVAMRSSVPDWAIDLAKQRLLVNPAYTASELSREVMDEELRRTGNTQPNTSDRKWVQGYVSLEAFEQLKRLSVAWNMRYEQVINRCLEAAANADVS